MGKTSLSTVNGGTLYKTVKNVLLMLTQTEPQEPAVAKTSAMFVSPQFILPSTKITPQNLPKLKYFIRYKRFRA